MSHRFIAMGVSAMIIAGCEGEPHTDALFPTKGILLQNGEPIKGGGGLMFVAETGGRGGCVFDASVNQDGTFEARTSRMRDTPVVFHPGLPIGTYKVIFHPAGNGAKTGGQIEYRELLTVEAKLNDVKIILPDRGTSSEVKGVDRDDDPNSPKFNPNRDKD